MADLSELPGYSELNDLNRRQAEMIADADPPYVLRGFGVTPLEELYLPPPDAMPHRTASATTGQIEVVATFGDEAVLLQRNEVIRRIPYLAEKTAGFLLDGDDRIAARRDITLAMLKEPREKLTYPRIAALAASVGVTATWGEISPMMRSWWDHSLIVDRYPIVVPRTKARMINPRLNVTFSRITAPKDAA